MKAKLALSALLLFAPLVACTPNVSPDSYSVGAVGQVNRVVRGVIVSARPVAIAGTNTGIGAGAGAIAGGTGGSTFGGSVEANIVGAVAGAVIGGVVGAAIEEGATRQTGMEYVIEAENAALITLVQGDEVPLSVGTKVMVIYGTRARVIAAPNDN
jgi:outer membrane lipoprotein SlyB